MTIDATLAPTAGRLIRDAKGNYRPRVYISGPYTNGNKLENVKQAIVAAEQVVAVGGVPYVPHLTHLWHELSPHDWEYWMDIDMAWVQDCDMLWRLPGESKGADIEVLLAKQIGIPVYTRELDIVSRIMEITLGFKDDQAHLR